MHFDEVYHARTAMEFLQDWRYGEEHDIYEWTHPHLAKYAMAGGIVAWGDNQVTATADLGVPVVDAAIEPRRDDPALGGDTGGDRVDVATGSEVRSYDLSTRKLIATIPLPGARAIAMDEDGLRLVVGTDDGSIWTIDATALDTVNGVGSAALPQPESLGKVDGAVRRVFVPAAGGAVLVETSDDRVITLDGTTGQIRGTVQLKAAGDLAPGGTAPVVNAPPDAVADPKAAASALASIVGGDAKTYEDRLRSGGDITMVARISTADQRTKIENAIKTGALAGLTVDDAPLAAVADAKGVELIDPTSGGARLDGRRRRAGPRPRPRDRRRRRALRRDGPPADDRRAGPDRVRRGRRRHREERSRLHDCDGHARPGDPGPLQRRHRHGPRPGPDPGRLVLDDLRHQRERQPACRVRRLGPPVRSVRLGHGRRPRRADRRPRADPHVRPDRRRSRASTSGTTSSPGGCPASWRVPGWRPSSTCSPGSCSVADPSASSSRSSRSSTGCSSSSRGSG